MLALANAEFLEFADVISSFIPVDMQTAANNGDWINMRDYERMLCVLFKAAGTAGDDPVFTITQASDNAGTGSKALNFLRIREKIGTLTGVGQWTIVDYIDATHGLVRTSTDPAGTSSTVRYITAGTYTNTVSAEVSAIFACEIRATQLDVANGFTHVQLSIPDTGSNAQLGCGFCIPFPNKNAQRFPLSAL